MTFVGAKLRVEIDTRGMGDEQVDRLIDTYADQVAALIDVEFDGVKAKLLESFGGVLPGMEVKTDVD